MPFSIEMSDIELGKRFLVANSNFSAGLIRNPRYLPRERNVELSAAIAKVADLPIYVDDRGTLNAVATKIPVLPSQAMRTR
jgi:replicative DNA helicase